MLKAPKVPPRYYGSSVVIIEKLPSFITIVSQLTELNLSHVPTVLLDSISNNPALLKELPLRTNTEKLIEKMPSVWKKARLVLHVHAVLPIPCIVANPPPETRPPHDMAIILQ